MLLLKQIEIKINCVFVNYFLLFQPSLLSVVQTRAPRWWVTGEEAANYFQLSEPSELWIFRASLFQVVAEFL